MSKVVPVVPEGNIRTPSKIVKKRLSPAFLWCFTLNNPLETEINYIGAMVPKYCNIWIYQEERGENNTLHLQGFLRFIKKTRPKSVFIETDRICWIKCKGTSEQNIAYCSKPSFEGSRKWSNILEPPKLQIISDLYMWQKKSSLC